MPPTKSTNDGMTPSFYGFGRENDGGESTNDGMTPSFYGFGRENDGMTPSFVCWGGR